MIMAQEREFLKAQTRLSAPRKFVRDGGEDGLRMDEVGRRSPA